MRLSLNNLKGRAQLLRDVILDKERALEEVPDGNLKISYSHGKPQYWHVTGTKEKDKRYLSGKDLMLASSLAQKSYDMKVLSRAWGELGPLQKLVNQYESGTFEDVINDMSLVRQTLVVPSWLSDDDFISQWLDDPYTGLGFEEGSKEYYASSGLRVRSKSEASIADKYEAFSVPMKFEKPVRLEGYGIVYPDFTVLNIRMRKIYIHEHMGMMDDPEYAENNTKKITAYQKNGYYPGKNLILTFETKGTPFDPRLMDDIIKQYLL